METPSNYRVKIDLSQFYDDARKLSYVFVSEKNISHILHLHERIREVFGIKRPFYLISDGGVYLPLNEDIRIVKEDETVKVCQGFGNPDCLNVWREMGVKCNGRPLPSIQVHKNVEEISKLLSPSKNNQTVDSEASAMTSNKDNEKNIYDNSSVTILESAVQCPKSFPDDSDSDTTHYSKNTTRSSILEFFNVPKRKRKRVRKRKPKQSPEVPDTPRDLSSPVKNMSLLFNSNHTSATKPKHLKFNWDETEGRKSPKYEEKKESKASEVPELRTLLSLKNSQFPVAFVGQKIRKNDVPMQEYFEINVEVNPHGTNSKITENLQPQKSPVKIYDCSQINPLNFPICNQELVVGDIVAFRTLKMAEDYSPTVSGYIVAEILSANAGKSDYSFKIISGGDQLRNPEGKFSLPGDDETKNIQDTSNEPEIYTMGRMELIEPRLINRTIA